MLIKDVVNVSGLLWTRGRGCPRLSLSAGWERQAAVAQGWILKKPTSSNTARLSLSSGSKHWRSSWQHEFHFVLLIHWLTVDMSSTCKVVLTNKSDVIGGGNENLPECFWTNVLRFTPHPWRRAAPAPTSTKAFLIEKDVFTLLSTLLLHHMFIDLIGWSVTVMDRWFGQSPARFSAVRQTWETLRGVPAVSSSLCWLVFPQQPPALRCWCTFAKSVIMSTVYGDLLLFCGLFRWSWVSCTAGAAGGWGDGCDWWTDFCWGGTSLWSSSSSLVICCVLSLSVSHLLPSFHVSLVFLWILYAVNCRDAAETRHVVFFWVCVMMFPSRCCSQSVLIRKTPRLLMGARNLKNKPGQTWESVCPNIVSESSSTC